jgi:uncharacterized delta-60 repeat protein
MKKLITFLSLLTASFIVSAQSQLKVFPDWSSTTGSQNFFYKNVVKTDGSGNVYIAGATINGSGNYDILVAKFDPQGKQLWIQQYNGAGNGNDVATGLYIDGSGNVYITGEITTASNIDAVTIKYNSSGTQQWLRTYNGTGSAYDCGADIITDGSGNVFITGTTTNSSGNYDVITIKYNSSGTQQWATPYDYTAHLNDAGAKIALDAAGKVVISCAVQSASTTYIYGVLKYNASTGVLSSGTTGGTSTTGISQVNDMVLDASGNIYIAGAATISGHGYDYDVIKLNSSLSIAWEQTYNANNLDDIAKGIQVDASGNVYVTGYSTSSTQGKNIATVKYNSSGTQQWVQTYNDNLNGDDEANAMVIDASGNIIITGDISTAIDHADYFTAKYDASGNMLWSIQNDGNAHLNDKATNIAIDVNGDIIVTGESETAPGTYQYGTVKYVERQIITPADYNSESPQNSFLYYVNNGQLIDTQDSLIPSVRYYTNNSSPAFYIKKNSFSFVFAHVDTIASTNDTLQRIDATFEEVGSGAKTYAMTEQESYLNYYLGHCPSGVTEVHGNERLITYNLYPYIDLMYSSNQNGIKYYFIVKPGGYPENIRMDFTGATSFNLDGSTNALTIHSLIGNLTFERPTAYQLSSTNTVIPITGWQCAWQTNGASNKYKFYTSTYDSSKPLIIQVDLGHSTATTTNPPPCWSTFFGGSDGDQGEAITTDNSDYLYVSGGTLSTDFPTTNGIQTGSLGANEQAFFAKFDNNHQYKFSTYFGGNNIQDANDIKVKSTGEIYICGYTKSSAGTFPWKFETGAFNYDALRGSSDGFIAKFNNVGTQCLWATYFGGTGDDRSLSLIFDSNNNLYIAGFGNQTSATTSGETFPLLNPISADYSTNFQTTNKMAAFIGKFDANDAQAWCTFYGGNNNDWASCVKVDKQDNPFILGSTYSTDFPTPAASTTPFVDATLGGTIDDFIVKFNSSGVRQWASLIGGSGDEFVTPIGGPYGSGNRISFDSQNNIYIAGSTESSDFPIPSTYYDNTYKIHSGYILKFDASTFEQLWGTYISGNGHVDLNSIVIDSKDRVFAGGCTSDNAFPVYQVSNVYYQGAIAGSTTTSPYAADGCIVAFDNFNNRIYGTYFGGDQQFSYGEFIWGMALHNDELYFTGYTSTQIGSGTGAFPLNDPNPGNDYYTDVYGGGYQDAFISELCFSASDLGISTIAQNNNSLLLYPNPASDEMSLSIETKELEGLTINIDNTIGQIVKTLKYDCHYGKNNVNLSVNGLNNGIYYVNVKGKNMNETIKFIKIN